MSYGRLLLDDKLIVKSIKLLISKLIRIGIVILHQQSVNTELQIQNLSGDCVYFGG